MVREIYCLQYFESHCLSSSGYHSHFQVTWLELNTTEFMINEGIDNELPSFREIG